jgi:hypothetical protein
MSMASRLQQKGFTTLVDDWTPFPQSFRSELMTVTIKRQYCDALPMLIVFSSAWPINWYSYSEAGVTARVNSFGKSSIAQPLTKSAETQMSMTGIRQRIELNPNSAAIKLNESIWDDSALINAFLQHLQASN